MKFLAFLPYFVFFLASGLQAGERIEDGFVDLTSVEFEKTIPLDGEWEFYWNELIYQGGFEESDPNFIEFPSLWNEHTIDGESLPNTGYATYRLRMVLPDSLAFTLHVEDMYSAFSLYLNGELIAKNGKVATTREEYVPEWKPMFVPIENLRDTNELILHIANFDHSKGGALEGIEIGTSAFMADKEFRIVAYDLILTGCLLMGGLFFLGLYLFGRHDKSIFYFSLFCLAYSYRIIGFGYYVFHSMFDLSWYITIRLEYIALFWSAFFFGRFVYHLYPEEGKRMIWDAISTTCIVFVCITIFFPVWIFTRLVEPFLLLLLVYMALTLYIYVRAKINKRPGAFYALISTGVVLLVFFYTILTYLGVLELVPSASFWGYILFFFSQSLILSYRFAYFLKKAKLDAELAAQAKTDFLSTISHEIRTPLNGVVGISHLMLEENPRADQVDNLTSLKYSAEHLTSLINDILDYNKLESGNFEFEEMDVDLRELAERIHQAYRAKALEKQVEMCLFFDERIVGGVLVDKTRLNQILNNLIDNAIKFTRKGNVTFRVIMVNSTNDSMTIRYEIEDTGIGIPREKQQAIFERFTQASSSTTREFGGTGLGLSIIKRLLELQGTQINLKSEEGKGSVFYFEQKYKKGSAHFVKPVTFDDDYLEHKLANKRILLVEDNPMNVLVTEKFLRRWKMKMDIAENGKIALDKTFQNYYDIVLMDLQMPVMDGYEASHQIRNSKNPVPIIALTASTLLHVQEKVFASGMNDYITKPFDPKELIRKLAKNMKR